MKLRRTILLNPGPTTTTFSVKKALMVPDICPREREFSALLEEVSDGLLKVGSAGKTHRCVMFAGSGTAAVDAVLSSVIPDNGKVLIINNGAYGKRMIDIAVAYNIRFVECMFPWYHAADPGVIEKAIANDHSITHVSLVHHETTTGILNPLDTIARICQKRKKTIIVDAISSFGGVPIDIEPISYLISTSNKCLQGMPGLSFVLCRTTELQKCVSISPRCYYLNLYRQYRFWEEHRQMQFTPPVQVVYALAQALREFFREGLQNRFKRYLKNWRVLTEGLKKLGFKLLLDPQFESKILTTVVEPTEKWYSFYELHDRLYRRGFTIYPGKLGEIGTFRLSVMGAIDSRDIRRFLMALADVVRTMKQKNENRDKRTCRGKTSGKKKGK